MPDALAYLVHRPIGLAAVAVFLGLVLVALFAPAIATHDPNRINPSIATRPPSTSHWMGTDGLGRDVFSRVVYGARISLLIGGVSTGVAAVLGLAVGLVSAYRAGWVDLAIQRVVDATIAMPTIIFALAIVAALGPSARTLMSALALMILPRVVRIVRAQSVAVAQEPYVDAARSLGAAPHRVMLFHVAPNVLAPWIVVSTAELGRAIILESALSFLGAGIRPPTASWGSMLRGEALQALETSPWVALFPAMAVTLAVFSINLVGDIIRDMTDPRLRGVPLARRGRMAREALPGGRNERSIRTERRGR